jgi:hypothetical protein
MFVGARSIFWLVDNDSIRNFYYPGFLLPRGIETSIGSRQSKNLRFIKIPVDYKLRGIRLSQETFVNRITVSSKKNIFTTALSILPHKHVTGL